MYPIPWGFVKVEFTMENRRRWFIVQYHTITRNMIPRRLVLQNCYPDDLEKRRPIQAAAWYFQQDGGASSGRFHINPSPIVGCHPVCPVARGILFYWIKHIFAHYGFLKLGETLCIPTPEIVNENKKRAAHPKSALPF